MEWLGFLGSIISGIIGGLFTFLGVKVTIKNDEKKRKKEELDKVIEKRPRFEIIDYKGFDIEKNKNDNCFEITFLDIKNFYCEGSRAYFDYDKKSEEAYTFFKTVQNKLHYAITSHTAAELIYERASWSSKKLFR